MNNGIFVFITFCAAVLAGSIVKGLVEDITDKTNLHMGALMGTIIFVMVTALKKWRPIAHDKLYTWLALKGE